MRRDTKNRHERTRGRLKENSLPELMSVQTFAHFADMTEDAVRGAIKRGTLVGVMRIGRRIRIRRSAWERC
jgi:hypothetical protein